MSLRVARMETLQLEKSKSHAYVVSCGFICQLLFFNPLIHGQDTLGEAIDCTDIRIDYSDDPALTREERLRLMDKAFFESLNKFEYCQSLKSKNKAADGGGSGEGSIDTAGESVASSTMSGTETPQENNPSKGPDGADRSDSLQGSQDMDETVVKPSERVTGSSGKPPEDIPSAENDDILAAQIRYAAEHETDPVKREQLWDEYRKYKGMAPAKK